MSAASLVASPRQQKSPTAGGAREVTTPLIDRAAPEIIGNVIDTDGVALEVHEGVQPTLRANELCGANAIMAVMRGGMPLDLSDDTLCDEAPLVFD